MKDIFSDIQQRKDNTYYDQTGKQILVGDLLKVFHFKVRKRTHYMYHVAVMESTLDFPVMAVSAYHVQKPHCRMYVLADEKRILRDYKIVSELDFQTKRKKIKPQNTLYEKVSDQV